MTFTVLDHYKGFVSNSFIKKASGIINAEN